MSFDESKVVRGGNPANPGEFSSKDSMRNSAGQLDVFDSNIDLLDERTMLDMAAAYGNRMAARSPLHEDPDDLSGELVVRLMQARQTRLPEAMGNRSKKYIEKPLMRAIAQKMEREVASGRAHPLERKARAILQRRMSEFEAANHREMTYAERQQLVHDITNGDDFVSGQRPPSGWDNLHRGRTMPLEYADPDGGESVFNSRLRTEDVSHTDAYFENSSAGLIAQEELEAMTPSERMASAWDLMRTQREGLPDIERASVGTGAARKAVAVMNKSKVSTTAYLWMNDELDDDDPRVQALVTPFQNASREQQREVAQLMCDNPAFAQPLWNHAMGVAKKPVVRKE